MLKKIAYSLTALALPILLLSACAALKGSYALPTVHPAELTPGVPPVCTECHEGRTSMLAYEKFDHTATFAGNHRIEGYQDERLCAVCHQTSFCNDCHATRVELKPSLKNQSDTFRTMPHRGDYRSRHIIDGRIDPTSCFRCHGNPKTALSCRTCHG